MRVKELDLDLLAMLKDPEMRAKRKVLSRILEGAWTTVLKGRGMEFAGFRKYEYGDDASTIDWGATLRSKDTLIREFEEYKNITVFFLLDVSDSMLFTSAKKMKAEYAAEAMFTLAAAILDNSDSVGFALFTDEMVAKLYPGVGNPVIYQMAIELQKPRNYGGNFSLKQAVNIVEGYLKTKVLIILVSDFIGMDPGWERYIKIMAQKHELIGVAIRDPRERELPNIGAQFLIQDPFTKEKLYVDMKQYKEIYDEVVAKDEKYLRSVFDKAHAGLIVLDPRQDMLASLLEFFKKRTRILQNT